MALTPKQRAFVAAYAGNATEAARAAGYSAETAKQQGSRLLTNADVAEAIRTRQDKRESNTIATREERQAFWSQTMRSTEQDMNVRLKASELLGKSEADFTDKVAGPDGGALEIVIRTVTA